MKKQTKTYKVTYTKANGKEGQILVKADNEVQALKRAKFHCFTGTGFRNPEPTNDPYIKPSKQGFSGSHRQN